jgi:hypothetical protein
VESDGDRRVDDKSRGPSIEHGFHGGLRGVIGPRQVSFTEIGARSQFSYPSEIHEEARREVLV